MLTLLSLLILNGNGCHERNYLTSPKRKNSHPTHWTSMVTMFSATYMLDAILLIVT